MKLRAWHKEKKRWFTFDEFAYCDEYNIMGWYLCKADRDPEGGSYCNLISDTDDWEKIEVLPDNPPPVA